MAFTTEDEPFKKYISKYKNYRKEKTNRSFYQSYAYFLAEGNCKQEIIIHFSLLIQSLQLAYNPSSEPKAMPFFVVFEQGVCKMTFDEAKIYVEIFNRQDLVKDFISKFYLAIN